MFIIIIKCSFSYGAVRCISAVAGTRTECAVCVCVSSSACVSSVRWPICIPFPPVRAHLDALWRVLWWSERFFLSSPSTLAVIRAAPSMLDELLPGSVLVVRNEPAIPLDCWLADASDSELGPASVEEAFRHRGLRLRVQDLSREMILAQFFTSPHQSPHPHRGASAAASAKKRQISKLAQKNADAILGQKFRNGFSLKQRALREGFLCAFVFVFFFRGVISMAKLINCSGTLSRSVFVSAENGFGVESVFFSFLCFLHCY